MREQIESWRPTEVDGIELRRGFGVAGRCRGIGTRNISSA